MESLEMMKADESLADTLSEVYAGDDETYAQRLAEVASWAEAWRVMVDACAIARVSGDYLAAENIRERAGKYHAGLAEGRLAAKYERSAVVDGALRMIGHTA
jgi:hypothetical protein